MPISSRPFLPAGSARTTVPCSRRSSRTSTPGLIEPQVEALIGATGIDFRIGGNRAFYVPALDYVQVPPPQAYFEPINWHRTALHELGHATGHPSSLGRDMAGGFGSKKYAFEELVALS
jgi:antirestriction protein ArdC